MNVLQPSRITQPSWILHSILQPTHIVHVLGGVDSPDPDETLEELPLMPKAKKKAMKKKAKKSKKKK